MTAPATVAMALTMVAMTIRVFIRVSARQTRRSH
jgi:hypothetical protein